MRKVGANVDGDAVIGHPAADTNADRGDFRVLLLGSDPDPWTAFAPLAWNAVIAKRLDDPSFKAVYVTAHIAPALVEVQQDVGDELTRPVIGILSAAAGGVHWKARGIEQVCVPGACPCCIKWRVLQKPYEFRCFCAKNPRGPIFHFRNSVLVGDSGWTKAPLNGTGFAENVRMSAQFVREGQNTLFHAVT